MKKLLLLAATLFLLVAPFTYHPDTKLVLYYPSLNQGKVWDIYKYLNTNQDDAPKFHYPPMHYWVLKAEWPLVKLIGGSGVENWLKIGGNVAFNDPKIYLYNFACKLPLLILVLLSGVLIYKICLKNSLSKSIALRAAAIWFFNPLTLYSAVIMGQNDILAIFPFLIGLYFYKDKPYLAFLFFGLSGSIKSYPLIWAIILALIYMNANWFKKMILLMIPISVYFLSMAPFLGQNYFRQEVLYSGLSIRLFESALDIGFGDKLLVVPVLLVMTALIGIKKKIAKSIVGVATILLTATLLMLGFTHFHPQWFIWIMPFAAILIAKSKNLWWYVALVLSVLLVIILFDDKYLYWGLLTPISPDLINLPYISEVLLAKGVDVRLLNNLTHSIVAGVAFYWLWILGKSKNETKK